MVLEEGSKGSKLMTGGVDDLIPTAVGLKYYSGFAFLNNLVAGDSIKFVMFIFDPQSSTQQIYNSYTVNGQQSTKPATFIVNLPTQEFRVTAQQNAQGAGGFKTINFVRYDS